MRNRQHAFTLAEMLVVMGIIIVFILMAIPTIRTLTGNHSEAMARNEIASLLTRAREEAVAMQDTRGVLFFIDPAGDRVVGLIVQKSPLQDSVNSQIIMLDSLPGRDSITLPLGVRIQTIFNGANLSPAQPNNDDRYMGFNPLPTLSTPPLVGGCILFDNSGRLLVRQYGLQMAMPTGGTPTYSNIANLFNNMTGLKSFTPTSGPLKDPTTGSSAFVPAYSAGNGTAPVPYSQLGLVVFDYDAFTSLGYSDIDYDINQSSGNLTGGSYTTGGMKAGPITQSQSEQAEETWIDGHSTPILINRFNGTIIKAE